MELENGEKVILNEGIIGWRKTLAVTNRRLLFLKKDKIEDEIKLEEISEVHPHTQMFTSLTEMKVKLKNGNETTIIFKSSDLGLLSGGTSYAVANARTMTDRYVTAINKIILGP